MILFEKSLKTQLNLGNSQKQNSHVVETLVKNSRPRSSS